MNNEIIMPKNFSKEQELRSLWDDRESKQDNSSFHGIQFHTELAGSDGCLVILFPHEKHTDADIEAAKSEARSKRDVVHFYVRRVPEKWYTDSTFEPDKNASTGWAEAVKWIVDNKQCRRVHRESGQLIPENKSGGVLVDLFSASALNQMAEKFKKDRPDLLPKFLALPVDVAVTRVFAAMNNK